MTIKISPIAEEHIPGFHGALDAVAREKKYIGFFEAPPLEKVATFVRDNIKNDHAQFVAVSGEKVIGWCDIFPGSRPINTHVGTLGIGIINGFRGQGIGRRLMTAAIDKAKGKGMTRIELGVRTKNENAMALYKKLGFEVEGLKKRACLVDGVYEDLYEMAILF